MRRHVLAAIALFTMVTSATFAQSDAPPPPSAPARPTPPSAAPTTPPSKAETDRTGLLMRSPKPNVAGFIGDPYPLDTCIVSGEKLGPDAVTLILKDQPDAQQEGRHLKFCCKECLAKFEASPRGYLAKLDEAIIKAQHASYPLERCLVMLDEKLAEDTKDIVYGNRCYVVCCKKCVNNFVKNTARYVTAYEKALMGRQRANYPLDTCVVSGEKLGEKHVDFVIGHTMLRVCCEDCMKKALENPAPYVAKVTEARAKAATPAK